MKGGIDWIGVTLLGAALILLNVGLGSPEMGSDRSTAAPPQNRLYWVAGAAVGSWSFSFRSGVSPIRSSI